MMENTDNVKIGKHSIKIGYFINPHMFWFRYDIQEHNANITFIEFKLKQYYNNTSQDGNGKENLSVENDDIVAVHLVSENSYVRAKIHTVDRNACNLWAIDYGYPIISDMCNIKKLPRHIANLDSLCFNAGIDGVVPSKLIYTSQEMKSVLDLEMWCWRAIDESRKLINLAAQTAFVLTSKTNITSSIVKMNTFQLFGQLKITNQNGKTVDLAQHLKFLNLARDCTSNFEKIRLMKFDNIFSTEPIVKNFPSTTNQYTPFQRSKEVSNDEVKVLNLFDEHQPCRQTVDSKANKISELLKRKKILNAIKAKELTTEKFQTNILNQEIPKYTTQESIYTEHFKNKTLKDSSAKNGQLNMETGAVYVQSKFKPKAIESISQANFCKEIHEELKFRYIDKVYRIQAYTWPHLLRGNSLVAINSAKTGRTFIYLPSLCSSILMQFNENRVPNGNGPLAIIICASSSEVEYVADVCKCFYKTSLYNIQVIKTHGVRNYRITSMQLLNGCDILVSTPSSLVRLCDSKIKLIQPRRLEYLVFDDTDEINQIKILTKLLPTFNVSSPSVLPFQFILIAKNWQNYMERYLKLTPNLMVCIGDFIEAAVYSNASINIKLTTNSTKISKIIDFIDKHPHNREKLVIICNSDKDVKTITKELIVASYLCISFYSSSTVDELLYVNEWKVRNFNSEILICTDNELPELNVQNAQNLIHYSLPSSWSKFKFRFSTLIDNYYNRDFDINNYKRKPRPKCLLLLDEDNNTQLPKLVDFMELHHQIDCVPQEIQNLTNQIKIKREEQLIKKEVPFCSRILEFGSCTLTNCKDRHILCKMDQSNDDIPKSGNVKLHILNIVSPTHYNVRLIEYAENENYNWHYFRKSNEFAIFSFEMAIHMGSIENRQMYWPLLKNDLCALEKDNAVFRCQILEINSPKDGFSTKMENVSVIVRLVDDGRIVDCKSSNLLTLPKEFQSFPFQAVSLRLSGLVPYDNEHTWDPNCIDIINLMLERKYQPGDSFIASVNFTLLNTIWVNHFILMEKVETSQLIYKLNLKTMLIKKQIASKSSIPIEVIQSLAKMCGIILSSNDTKSEKETAPETKLNGSTLLKERIEMKTSEITMNNSKNGEAPVDDCCEEERVIDNWAELETFEFIRVSVSEFYTPHRFYVQNTNTPAVIRKLDKMHELITDYQCKNPVPIKVPEVLKNCISLFDGQFCRAKITKIICDGLQESPSVQIFFCDIGHSMITSIDNIFESSQEIINFLPFQAVCCKLTGINSKTNNFWMDEVCQTIYNKYLSEGDSTFIYSVKHLSSENALNFNTYEVVLLNCDGKTELNINNEIIEQGWADYDNDTQHYLDLIINRPHLYDAHNIDMVESKCSEKLKTIDLDIEYKEDQVLSLLNIKEKDAKILALNKIHQENTIADNNKKILLEEKSSKTELNQSSVIDHIEKDKIKQKKVKKIKIRSLTPLYKAPHTIWYQNDSYIVLKISAPDLEDYSIDINDFELLFTRVSNLEKNVLIINFLGTVNSEMSYYQIRGINIIVWLQKAIAGLSWPRLTLETDKWYWLTNETKFFEKIETGSMKLPIIDQLSMSEESDIEDDGSDTNANLDDSF